MDISERVREIARSNESPFVLMDLDIIEDNYDQLVKDINGVRVFYAVKANSHPRIIKRLYELGSSFDVASRGEIELLLNMGIPGSRLSFGNTIKKEEDIRFAFNKGINYFAADAEMELEKIARNAPGAQVYLRLAMNGSDSDWPLSRKFGTNIDHVKKLVVYANDLGLAPIGVSFHVGSQCYDKYSWKDALMQVADIFWFAKLEGIKMTTINLGGGIPVKYVRDIPTVAEIAAVINESIDEYFNFMERPTLFIEPGRSMVGNAGILISRVLLRSSKEKKDWVYIDAGVYHGLMETIENLRYTVVVDGKDDHPKKTFTLAGPTCDSIDVVYDEVELPEDITLGDIVYFVNAGAYTLDYKTHFNGIEGPYALFLDEVTTKSKSTHETNVADS